MEQVLLDDVKKIDSSSLLKKDLPTLRPSPAIFTTATAATANKTGGSSPTVSLSLQPISQSFVNTLSLCGSSSLQQVDSNGVRPINQLVFQGLGQIGQNQIQQPITVCKQINSNNSSTIPKQHILVRKPNVSSPQMMPLIATEESSIQTQTGDKSGIAFLGSLIKGSISVAQIPKPKLVIAPAISQVPQVVATVSTNSSYSTAKPMTNLLLPVNVSQQSTLIPRQNPIPIKPNLSFKLNANGKICADAKNSSTIVEEPKTANSSTPLPPLHPIVRMSLLTSSTATNSTDCIKISENPDSAVITPIPIEDESNVSEKQKKVTNNSVKRATGKRPKKQIFPKASNSEANVIEVVSYSASSPESDHETDNRRDKESDDDITFLKVVASDEKRVKRALASNEIKIEVIKGSTRKEVELVDKYENGIDEEIIDDDESQQSDPKFDVAKVLEWKDGVGSLPGSTLKFRLNEFGLMEVVDEDDSKQGGSGNLRDKENFCSLRGSSKSSTPTIITEKKTSNKKSRLKNNDSCADTFYCCEGCGCHGLASEFDSPNSCSASCTEYIESLKWAKKRKDKELKERELKRKRKKLLLETQKKINIEQNDSNSSKNFEIKVKSESDEDTKDTNISVVDEESPEESDSKHPWQTGKLGFSWAKYLEHTKSKAAPVKLFKDPFPYSRNNFKVGMKLEGIDPNHPAHYCVLTVAEVVGYRIRLHFDGYPENYDFWVNADSMDIFPVGWAEKSGHKLDPPKGYVQNNFSWNAYLKSCRATAAPKTLFTNKMSMVPTGFRVGMKLEAVDRKHSSAICVASVSDVMDSRVLVHFDSWDDIYDYWADVTSPYIHPIGWCNNHGHDLTPPNYYKDSKSFSWDSYLKETQACPAPSRAFKQRPPCAFKRGMKLEVVDKRLPQLIRVATIEDVKDHMLKIRFDGWPESHAYWVDDDSTDIHPMGWCSKTGHPLEAPLTQDNLNDRPECGTYGCRGIGHVKGPKFATHNSASGCPYSPQNLNKSRALADRLSLKQEVHEHDEGLVLNKYERSERIKAERIDHRYPTFDEKPIKMEHIKQEDLDSDEKNEKIEYSHRTGGKWRNNSEGLTDDEEYIRKKKKRKLAKDDPGNLPMLYSNNDSSASRMPYAANMPDKQLRNELYQSVYDPGYNPLPDAPHIWAKHSNALNRIVAKQNTNPRRWSNEEVIKFIEDVPNCREIGSIFRKHNIDGESFLMMTQEDLVSLLGLRLGPAIKLYNSIVLLRKRAT
ncbi:hypothetical protein QAD02_018648 [Eretmocerus hayati]|uniref:Uncharacterized protein n=1 Tax=Eretmocerus hayati TaxID=131215 RepID=A0ACC2PJ46_9HYME|nr:hypothetical protein QAD02_018648 [Eretmocerus hayati]